MTDRRSNPTDQEHANSSYSLNYRWYAKLLRRYLNRKGYTLMAESRAEKWRHRNWAAAQQRRQDSDCQSELWKIEERLREAQVEARVWEDRYMAAIRIGVEEQMHDITD